MLLEGKNAVVYGGGGSIGGAVARGFAREGARVFLAGRTQARLDAVAEEIRAAGGSAETAVLDALDERAVDAHVDAVAAQAGSLDISVNVIQHGDVQGTPMAEMAVEDYLRPVETGVRTTFITWRAAARHMIRQRGGVIIAFGGDGDPMRDHYLGGLQTGLTAIETMRRQLATEAGPHGVRVVTMRSGGVPESIPEGFPGREAIVQDAIVKHTLLGRAAELCDIGDVAAFIASDRARTMTAATVNVSCGALLD
jgi:NAD(P)-dependent dehydrogenase (short-subunit alcohol dehydrogenase family)